MKKMMPPTYFYILIVLSILLHFIFPIKQIISYPYTLIGILMIILGSVLNICAWQLFMKNKTTQNPFKNPNKFVRKGIYRITRNPMYLGMTFILLGISIILGSLIAFLSPILFFIIMQKLFIPLEEKNMKEKFGKKYSEYKKQVRRWI